MDKGRLPRDARELIAHDFSSTHSLDNLLRADSEKRLRLLGKYINPATGELYASFIAAPEESFGLNIRIVPKAQWDSSYPDTANWLTADGKPTPVKYASHVTLYGEDAGQSADAAHKLLWALAQSGYPRQCPCYPQVLA